MGTLLKKNIYASYVVQICNIVVNFAYSLVLVHQLGASAYGEYAVFFNSLAFAVLLFGFNLPAVIVFFIANKRIDAGKILFSSLLFTLFAAACLFVVLLLSGYLKFAVHIFPDGNNKLLWIFFFSAMFFLLQANQLLQAFLNAHKIFIPIAFFLLISNIALLVFWMLISFNVVVVDTVIFNLIWTVSILVNVLLSIYSVYLIRRKIVINSFWKLINLAELRLVAGFAGIVYVCNTLQFLNYKMDIWFVNFYKGKEEAGVYALALSLSQLVWVLPNAVSAVLLNYFQVAKKKYSVLVMLNYARISFYASIVTAIILSAIYYFAIPYFYGAQFYNTFILCLILFAGVIPFSLSIIIANLNSGIGFVRLNLYATIFTLVLCFILDFALIPLYGMQGAAIAKVVIYICGLLFQIVVGQIFYQLPWQSMFQFPKWKRLFKSNL